MGINNGPSIIIIAGIVHIDLHVHLLQIEIHMKWIKHFDKCNQWTDPVDCTRVIVAWAMKRGRYHNQRLKMAKEETDHISSPINMAHSLFPVRLCELNAWNGNWNGTQRIHVLEPQHCELSILWWTPSTREVGKNEHFEAIKKMNSIRKDHTNPEFQLLFATQSILYLEQQQNSSCVSLFLVPVWLI